MQTTMRGQRQVVHEYIARINRVIDHIELHIAEPLTLDELAAIANFSKFHFHRIFFSFTGETLFQFIQRLRLERAANLLHSGTNKSITEIAFDSGFTNPSSFAKSFKRHFGVSATAWRGKAIANSNLSKVDSNIRQAVSKHGEELLLFSVYTEYINNSQIWRVTMNNTARTVEVKELTEMTVAYVRYVGPYKGDAQLFESLYQKLFKWAGPRTLLNFPKTKSIIIYHDNPQVTEDSKLRISVCINVPPDTAVDGEIGKMTIPAGKYAMARFSLGPSEFVEAWDWVYGTWLPNSGYTCDDRPCFEYYYDEGNTEGRFDVAICLPVTPL